MQTEITFDCNETKNNFRFVLKQKEELILMMIPSCRNSENFNNIKY